MRSGFSFKATSHFLIAHAPAYVCGVLTALIGSEVIGLLGVARPTNDFMTVTNHSGPREPDAMPSPTVSLFGQPQTHEPSAAVPESSVHLRLIGTMATTDPHHGVAIIAQGVESPRTYSPGATIGGAVITGIYADRIILERLGQSEVLSLPGFSGAADPLSSQTLANHEPPVYPELPQALTAEAQAAKAVMVRDMDGPANVP